MWCTFNPFQACQLRPQTINEVHAWASTKMVLQIYKDFILGDTSVELSNVRRMLTKLLHPKCWHAPT